MTDRLMPSDEWKMEEEAKRLRSHARQARENAMGRYATIAQQRENNERAARLDLRAAEIEARLAALRKGRE